MAAADPKARSRNARIAANASWAKTPDRAARASAGHRASPQSLDYWRTWARTTYPDMPAKDQLKAARNAHRSHMQQMAAKSVRRRAENKAKARGEQPAA